MTGVEPRVSLVVGATGAIGRACVRRLAAAGDRVVLAARGAQALSEVASELVGVEHLTVSADVTTPEGAAEIARAAVARFGRLDLGIQAFGYAPRFGNPIDRLRVEDLRAVLWPNLRGLFLALQAQAKLMKPGGVLIALGSNLAEQGWAGQGPYVVAKHGARGLLSTWAAELREVGLHLQEVDPGLVASPTLERLAARPIREGTLDLAALPGPEDVAEVVFWLASEAGVRAVSGRPFVVGPDPRGA